MSGTPSALRRAPEVLPAVVLAVAIAAWYLSLTPWTTLWDRDEPRFARAAVEMTRSGQYLYPTFNGDVRPQKPILIYWLMALSIRAFGPTEFAVRFWSPIGLALAAFFTYLAGRRLLSPRAGLFAMTLVALTPLAAVEGVAATTDAFLLASVTGAFAATVYLLTGGRLLPGGVWLAAALSAAQLFKGPVGLALPLLTTVVALALARGTRQGDARVIATISAAAVASTIVFASWAVPADAATRGRIVATTLVRENVARFLTPMDGHGGELLSAMALYPAVVLIGFLPWSALLPAGFRALGAGRAAGPLSRALITAAALTPLAFFTLSATKLPHYILPSWPALALAVAALLDPGACDTAGVRAWIRRGAVGTIALTVILVAAIAAAAFLLDTAGARPAAAVLAALVAAGGIDAASSLRRCEPERCIRRLVPFVLAAHAVLAFWLMPAVDRLKPVPVLAVAVRRHAAPAAAVATYRFEEPSLYFYLDQGPVATLDTGAGVARWAHEPAAGVLVTTRAALNAVLREYGPLPLEPFASAAGVNVTKGTRVELVAVERTNRR